MDYTGDVDTAFYKRFNLSFISFNILFEQHFVAGFLWVLPVGEKFHGSDVELLSRGDVLAVCKLHCSPHSAGQTLIQPGAARCGDQLQPRTDHMTHNCDKNKQPFSFWTFATATEQLTWEKKVTCTCKSFGLNSV